MLSFTNNQNKQFIFFLIFYSLVFGFLAIAADIRYIRTNVAYNLKILCKLTKKILKGIINDFYPLKWLKINIWNKLWIRKNEFHESLELDHEAMLHMTKKQVHKYLQDIGSADKSQTKET